MRSIKIYLQYLLPHHFLSRVLGKLMNSENIKLKDFLIKQFIKVFNINMHETLVSDISKYKTFNQFFTRELKPEVRSIVDGEKQIACPVDGTVSQVGKIKEGRIFQAKNFDFSLHELLGGDETLEKHFDNGNFATLYLAPKDYHRVHMPLEGHLKKMILIPGQLFSVNRDTTHSVPQLFARNERVVCVFESDAGEFAMILVGAMLVASIHTVWSGEVTPPHHKAITKWSYEDDPIQLNKGDEMGHFQYGSTVIMLFPKDMMAWRDAMKEDDVVQFGSEIGSLMSSAKDS